jgi:hypothetical protein
MAKELDGQILALENPDGQYMWTTWRKRDGRNREKSEGTEFVSVRAEGNASILAKFRNLPDDCALRDLSVEVGGHAARPSVIFPRAADGSVEIRIQMPALREAGRLAVSLRLNGTMLSPARFVEVTAASARPVVVSLTDAVNYAYGTRIVSRSVKVYIENLADPMEISARVNGLAARRGKPYFVDRRTRRFDINFFLPRKLGPGAARFELFYGTELLATTQIQLGILQAFEVFRGAPAGARFVEIDGGEAVVVSVSEDGAPQAGNVLQLDPNRLPFRDRTVDGIVCRGIPFSGEIRRVSKGAGALYIEAREITESETGLPLRWARSLGGSKATVGPEWLRAGISLGLRAIDRCCGSRLAVSGKGFYFGQVWRDAPHKPVLNACVRCGRTHSSDQLYAADVVRGFMFLVFYLCPSCGCRNLFTLDR